MFISPTTSWETKCLFPQLPAEKQNVYFPKLPAEKQNVYFPNYQLRNKMFISPTTSWETKCLFPQTTSWETKCLFPQLPAEKQNVYFPNYQLRNKMFISPTTSWETKCLRANIVLDLPESVSHSRGRPWHISPTTQQSTSPPGPGWWHACQSASPTFVSSPHYPWGTLHAVYVAHLRWTSKGMST